MKSIDRDITERNALLYRFFHLWLIILRLFIRCIELILRSPDILLIYFIFIQSVVQERTGRSALFVILIPLGHHSVNVSNLSDLDALLFFIMLLVEIFSVRCIIGRLHTCDLFFLR